MARTVQTIALLFFVPILSCNDPENSGSTGNSSYSSNLDSPIIIASKNYFEYVTGKTNGLVPDFIGSQNMACEQINTYEVIIILRKDLYDKYAISTINPSGTNLKISAPGGDLSLSNNVAVSIINENVKITVRRNISVDNTGMESDGRYYPSSIWADSGRYTFISTKFLPTWYADSDGVYSEDQFSFYAYCSIILD